MSVKYHNMEVLVIMEGGGRIMSFIDDCPLFVSISYTMIIPYSKVLSLYNY